MRGNLRRKVAFHHFESMSWQHQCEWGRSRRLMSLRLIFVPQRLDRYIPSFLALGTVMSQVHDYRLVVLLTFLTRLEMVLGCYQMLPSEEPVKCSFNLLYKWKPVLRQKLIRFIAKKNPMIEEHIADMRSLCFWWRNHSRSPIESVRHLYKK